MDRLLAGALDAALTRRFAWLVSVLLLAGLAGFAAMGEADRSATATDSLPSGADSTRVVELEEQFASEDQSTAIVLFTSSDQMAPATLEQLRSTFAEASGGAPDALVPSEDGTAAFGVVPVQAVSATEVSDEVTALRDRLDAETPDGVTAQVTGPAAVQADLAAVFEGADLRLLAATAGVVAVLLILTYRSPVLWVVPLLVVGVADRAAAALATHALAAVSIPWDESTVGILSVLVFGAGTDYALLLISRYRDELRRTGDRYPAMRAALRRTAEAVVASSTTVVLGVLTLLLSVIPTTRGLGLACAVGILVAAFAALMVLPFTLVLFGRWVFWPVVPRTGQPTLAESRSWWRRVGDTVAGHPGRFVVATVVALGGLSAGVAQIETGLSPADQFLQKPEAIAAAERLAESFPAGTSDPTVVMTADPVGQVQPAVEGVPGVASVRPAGTAEEWTRLATVLSAPPGSSEARDTVTLLRDRLESFDRTYVGGTEAESLDAEVAAERDRQLIVPLILALVVVALAVLLRSLVAPVILVASVVATYLASLGASWWLFTTVLGFDRLDVGVPLLAFLFLVALGVDYNIFLVTRAAEEARTHGAREGMLRALGATGGVITSAGVLLAAVFAVLGVLPLVVLAQLGVVICVGVLLDTLVVRTVLVPAVAVALEDRFWWPRRLQPARHRADTNPEKLLSPAGPTAP